MSYFSLIQRSKEPIEVLNNFLLINVKITKFGVFQFITIINIFEVTELPLLHYKFAKKIRKSEKKLNIGLEPMTLITKNNALPTELIKRSISFLHYCI